MCVVGCQDDGDAFNAWLGQQSVNAVCQYGLAVYAGVLFGQDAAEALADACGGNECGAVHGVLRQMLGVFCSIWSR